MPQNSRSRTVGQERHSVITDLGGRLQRFEPLEPRLLLSASGSGLEHDQPANVIEQKPIDSAAVQVQWDGAQRQARAGEWIVRYDAELDPVKLNQSLAAGTQAAGMSLDALSMAGFGLLKNGMMTAAQAKEFAAHNDLILDIQPNFVYSIDYDVQAVSPGDPSFGQLWGLNNTGQTGGSADADIDAPEAWDVTTGSSDIVIAVIDTGVDYNHVDLTANMWMNPGEIAGDGIDNDQNGFVDDVYGYDFANNDSDPMDGNDHGTHVAGTIGAVGDNNTGVVGVNWDVSIMALKFLDDSGSGSTADAIEAVDYVTMMKRDFGVNVVATNNSWGGGGSDAALEAAITASGDQDILFIAAAGNDGTNNDSSPHYPSNYTGENIISVASTTHTDSRSSFSNYGEVSVDLGAPGSSIYSTIPGDRYASFNGTSMATPHVAGVVGLLAAADPDATAADLKTALLLGVDPISSMSGITNTGGRLNALGSLNQLVDLPPYVTSITPTDWALPTDQITIDFTRDMDPNSVSVDSFNLIADGDDDIFGTADDVVVSIASAGLNAQDARQAVVTTSSELPLESYRLTIAGTGAFAITDLDGIAIGGGEDHIHEFEITTAPGEFESNDAISEATDTGLVGPGTHTVSAAIGDGLYQSEDVDLFMVELTDVGNITADIDARTIGSQLDSWLRLFDSSGNQLASNDDTQTGVELDSYISEGNLAAGVYYIGVAAYPNGSYDPLTPGSGASSTALGNYDLGITVTQNGSGDPGDPGDPTDPSEPNDTLANAVALNMSTGLEVLDGEIGDGSWGNFDVDIFQLTADVGDTISAEVFADGYGSTLDSILRLFDTNGNELAVNDDTFGLDSYIEYTATTAGTYYFGLSAYWNFDYDPTAPGSGDEAISPGTYTIQFESDSATPPPPPGPATINGTLFDDVDGNGQQDTGEGPLDGWTVYLDADDDGQLDAGELTTTTDTNGIYTFTDLDAGDYVVRQIVPQDWQQTSPTADPPDQPGGEFQIDVIFPDSSLTPDQQQVFIDAAARWESLIRGDIPDISGVPGFGDVDDVAIEASAPYIDGPGGILGQAGPTYVRTDSRLPVAGIMQFDSADVADLEASGQFVDVIVHEMGHVIGIGTIWSDLGLVTGAGGSDPRFTGSQATAEYQSIFGTSESSVPVANTGGSGTRDAHWREATFDNELMTGYLNQGEFNPISRITAGSLADIGYEVDLDAADQYTPPAPIQSGKVVAGRLVAMTNDVIAIDVDQQVAPAFTAEPGNGAWYVTVANDETATDIDFGSQLIPVGPGIVTWSIASDHERGVGEVALVVEEDGQFVEPRNAGIQTFLFEFDGPIDINSLGQMTVQLAGLDVLNQPVDISGISGTVSMRSTTVVELDLSQSLPDFARYTMQIGGLQGTDGSVISGDLDRTFTALAGDVNGDGRVTVVDLSAAYGQLTDPIDTASEASIRSDVNMDGRVTVVDLSAAYAHAGNDSRNINDPVLALNSLQTATPSLPTTIAATAETRPSLEAAYPHLFLYEAVERATRDSVEKSFMLHRRLARPTLTAELGDDKPNATRG